MEVLQRMSIVVVVVLYYSSICLVIISVRNDVDADRLASLLPVVLATTTPSRRIQLLSLVKNERYKSGSNTIVIKKTTVHRLPIRRAISSSIATLNRRRMCTSSRSDSTGLNSSRTSSKLNRRRHLAIHDHNRIYNNHRFRYCFISNENDPKQRHPQTTTNTVSTVMVTYPNTFLQPKRRITATSPCASNSKNVNINFQSQHTRIRKRNEGRYKRMEELQQQLAGVVSSEITVDGTEQHRQPPIKQHQQQALTNSSSSTISLDASAVDFSESKQLRYQCMKELESLQKQDDPYQTKYFTLAHEQFKQFHNLVFVKIIQYCSSGSAIDVLYLDGYDGATTTTLLNASPTIDIQRLYTVNEWYDTYRHLQQTYFNTTTHSDTHVIHDSIQNKLQRWYAAAATTTNSTIVVPRFCAVYLDGCSGSSQSIITMVEYVMKLKHQQPCHNRRCRFGIGFTITNAEKSGKFELLDRIHQIVRATIRITNTLYDSAVSVHHVSDQPDKYGIADADGYTSQYDTTATCWLVIESNNK